MKSQPLITIGILDSKQNSMLYHITREMFMESGYRIVYNQEEISILAHKESVVVVIKLTPQLINHVYKLGLDIHILLHKNIDRMDYNNDFIKLMARKAKYIIMNIDDEGSELILNDDLDGLIISYGINPKATVTASSFEFSSDSKFILCLQREYLNLEGNRVEPMELPVILNLIGKSNMYYGLGVVACGLTCGINIEDIKGSLFNVKGMDGYLEKIYDGTYMVVENRCSSPDEYNLVLEEMQNIKYKEGYIINSIDIDEGIYTIKRNLKVILDWIPVLNIHKIFFHIDKREELLINNINLLLKNCKVEYEIIFKLNLCIERAMKSLGQDDLLLLLGGKSLKKGKKIVKTLI